MLAEPASPWGLSETRFPPPPSACRPPWSSPWRSVSPHHGKSDLPTPVAARRGSVQAWHPVRGAHQPRRIQLVRQYLVLNGRPLGEEHPANELPPPDVQSAQTLPDGRTMTTSDYLHAGRLLVRLVRVTDLAHAWSGGDAQFPYNDPRPPDATLLLGEFVAAQMR